jgi:hypothetical protein
MWKPVLWLSALGSLPFASASPVERAVSAEAPPTASHPTSLPHTPYSGKPTTTGALTASSIGTGIVKSASVAPAETNYPSNGKLNDAQPAPYTPAGGVGTNGSIPVYNVKSDFDYESLVCISHLQLLCRDMLRPALGSCTVPGMDRARSIPRRSPQILRKGFRRSRP